jgi:hypothetical protein
MFEDLAYEIPSTVGLQEQFLENQNDETLRYNHNK